MSVRPHAMTGGYLTLPIEFLAGGPCGMAAAPVPGHLAVHLKGLPIFDTGLQKTSQAT